MSLLQLPALNKLSLTHPPPPPPPPPPAAASSSSSSSHFPPIRAFARIDHQNPIFSPPPAIKERSLAPSTRPRKLLCRPPRGKYLGEDYLVKKMSAQEVQDLVWGEGDVPLIIDFYATWCGPCILMAQELEMLAVERENNAIIVKVDTDDEYEFAQDMQVRGLPTVYFISPDSKKEAIRTEGLIPLQMMRDILDNDM